MTKKIYKIKLRVKFYENAKNLFDTGFTLLKQNRLFSMLYIVGTGLAIAMTVIVAVVYYVKLAPIYPEENRKTRCI